MFIATYNAIYVLEDNGENQPTRVYSGTDHQCLGGRGNHRAMAVLPESGAVAVALSDGTLLILSENETTRIPTGIEIPIAALLVVQENPLCLLIGTDQGARVYRLTDETGPAERVETFDALACRGEWYTPWGGPPSVWNFAKTGDGFCYADIHVGSVMRSSDAGVSWQPVTPELHKDVHQVVTSPVDDDRVYANTANGVYVSLDRGNSWEHRSQGLPTRYGVALAVHPTDPDLLLAAVQTGPGGGEAYLCRSEDRGETWEIINDRLVGPMDRVIPNSVKFASDGTAWTVIGRMLYIGRDRASDWQSFWTAPEYDGVYRPPSDAFSLSHLIAHPIQVLAV